MTARCRTCGQDVANHRSELCRLFPGAPTREEAEAKRIEAEKRARRIAEAERAVLEAAEEETDADENQRAVLLDDSASVEQSIAADTRALVAAAMRAARVRALREARK